MNDIIGYPSEFWDRYKDGTLPESVHRKINAVFEKEGKPLNLSEEDIEKAVISDFSLFRKKHEQT